MIILYAFLIVIFILSVVVYIGLNIDKFKQKNKFEHQEPTDLNQEKINKPNNISIEQLSEVIHPVEKVSKNNLYEGAEFINRDCTNLDDFIIDENFNEYDLKKLANLNAIDLQIASGWYPLTINLIKELYDNGWNKKVSCIKEKYASLRFYTNSDKKALSIILEKYNRKSEYICETCGQKGEIRYDGGWDYVACRKHYLLSRGRATIREYGFDYNGEPYRWDDLINIFFEYMTFLDCYAIIINCQNRGERHEKGNKRLYVTKNTVGYVGLLNHVHNNYKVFPYDNYLPNFNESDFCKICGYRAVYSRKCECCENNIYGKDMNYYDSTDQYVKHYQMGWDDDEGDIYEQLYKTYTKNPDHKILYTADDLLGFKSSEVWEDEEN